MNKKYSISFVILFSMIGFLIVIDEYESTHYGFIQVTQKNLTIPTYDNSYQAMHPDVWYNSSGWNGWKYWMAMTPLTDTNESVENPSLVVSNDAINWHNPPNISNPFEHQNGSGRHNCDTDLVYNSSSNELYIYYLDSVNRGLGIDYLKLVKYNGTGNTTPKIIRSAQNYYMISPTVVYNNDYKMWMVNTTNTEGCYSNIRYVEYFSSKDGEVWSSPKNTTGLDLSGHKVWHINTQWIPSHEEYWMILMASEGKCTDGTAKLFFAKSYDGIIWTSYDSPFMTKDNFNTYFYKVIRYLAAKGGIKLEKNNNYNYLYRTAFSYDPIDDSLNIWYSARMKNNEWYTFYAKVNYVDFSSNLDKRN